MRSQLNPSLFNGRLGLFLWLFAVVLGIGLAGCQTQPSQPVDPNQSAADTQPEPSPCENRSVRELELYAIELLDRGDSQLARAVLDCTLEQHPNSYKARILSEQLDADPVSYLGRRNYPYTVQSSDTLSKIAQERLGTPLKFVILARYNGIAVPANLVAGQTIKIPGEAAAEPIPVQPEESVPEPEPPVEVVETAPSGTTAAEYRDRALANEKAGDLSGAFELVSQAKSADPSLENIDQDYARIKGSLIAELEEKAYGLELSGSVEEAVATWRRALEIDPRNIPAQLSINRLTQ